MRAFSPKRLRCSLKQCWFVNDCRRVRAAHAVVYTIMASDRTFNWSGLPASFASAGLSNTYQPCEQRTWTATLERAGTATGSTDGIYFPITALYLYTNPRAQARGSPLLGSPWHLGRSSRPLRTVFGLHQISAGAYRDLLAHANT